MGWESGVLWQQQHEKLSGATCSHVPKVQFPVCETTDSEQRVRLSGGKLGSVNNSHGGLNVCFVSALHLVSCTHHQRTALLQCTVRCESADIEPAFRIKLLAPAIRKTKRKPSRGRPRSLLFNISASASSSSSSSSSSAPSTQSTSSVETIVPPTQRDL